MNRYVAEIDSQREIKTMFCTPMYVRFAKYGRNIVRIYTTTIPFFSTNLKSVALKSREGVREYKFIPIAPPW